MSLFSHSKQQPTKLNSADWKELSALQQIVFKNAEWTPSSEEEYQQKSTNPEAYQIVRKLHALRGLHLLTPKQRKYLLQHQDNPLLVSLTAEKVAEIHDLQKKETHSHLTNALIGLYAIAVAATAFSLSDTRKAALQTGVLTAPALVAYSAKKRRLEDMKDELEADITFAESFHCEGIQDTLSKMYIRPRGYSR